MSDMPDVIWASHRPQDVGDRWTGPHKCYDDQTKYYRADAADKMLKEARHLLDGLVNYSIYNSMITSESNKLIARIDKFLGEAK